MDQSQEILLGHAIFASHNCGYRHIARLISINNKNVCKVFVIFFLIELKGLFIR